MRFTGRLGSNPSLAGAKSDSQCKILGITDDESIPALIGLPAMVCGGRGTSAEALAVDRSGLGIVSATLGTEGEYVPIEGISGESPMYNSGLSKT